MQIQDNNQRLQNGTLLQNGKYRIIRVLGQGGFGITYLAVHTMLDKEVAIKEFFPKEFCERKENTSYLTLGNTNTSGLVTKLKEKFLKEAKNISKLNHPNIVAIHDIFEENDTAYYLMDYIDGISLDELIKNKGPLPEPPVLKYMNAIGSALSYMHSKSMNHLDVKPANIMLRKMDDSPVLIDFGLSKQYDSAGEQTSTTPVGISHGFAPIEQYRPGGVSVFTPQTDIYALGATLYALLTGNTPPHYSDILEDGLPELPMNVSNQTVVAIEKAMEPKKTKRPHSIEEFLLLLPSTKQEIHSHPVINSSNNIPNSPNSLPNHQSDKQIDETVILLDVPLEHKTPAQSNEIISLYSTNTDEYIDLGLSVKWATKLSGLAIPFLHSDRYKFHLKDGSTLDPNEFLVQGYRLPGIMHFQELLEKCKWVPFSDKDIQGYKITGPNGNVLIMPLGKYNYYLSGECLKSNSFYYFLYLGEYSHTLAKGSSTEANIWTIKE